MEAIGRLAGGVAHDFNNLLTAIIGYSELLLEQLPEDADARADVDEIRKAGERASGLTRQLLAFSRQQILEPRVLDFNGIVANVEKLLRRVIGEDVELVIELDPAVGPVCVDPGQMEQVLMNLAVNARDAMPDGGRLCVRTRPAVLTEPCRRHTVTIEPGQYLCVSVSDSGSGIAPDILKQIFEPFFTTKDAGEGTGLGLSTVYGIVKQSAGYIVVDSDVGRGTVFDLYLPCVEAPLDVTTSLPVGSVQHTGGSETVLLVDDDAGIRELLRRALTDKGYRVLTASDGVEALSVAEAHSGALRLLITDLVMPRMGGAELATQLTAKRRDLTVLYMSGYTSRRNVSALPSGVHQAFLQKPFTPSTLVHKVGELLHVAATTGDQRPPSVSPRA
jgi:CheY-like chemotaxis protein